MNRQLQRHAAGKYFPDLKGGGSDAETMGESAVGEIMTRRQGKRKGMD